MRLLPWFATRREPARCKTDAPGRPLDPQKLFEFDAIGISPGRASPAAGPRSSSTRSARVACRARIPWRPQPRHPFGNAEAREPSSQLRPSVITAIGVTKCLSKAARRATASCPKYVSNGKPPPIRRAKQGCALPICESGWCWQKHGALPPLLLPFRLGLGGHWQRAAILELGRAR